MPYTDPDKQREAQARWYREKYQREKKFRSEEARRKAGWLQTEEGRKSNAAATARYRIAKLKKEKLAAKEGAAPAAPKKAAKAAAAKKPKAPAPAAKAKGKAKAAPKAKPAAKKKK